MLFRMTAPTAFASFLIAGTLILACSPALKHRVVRGPDGTRNWYLVEGGEQHECLRRVAQVCPSGYVIASNDHTGGETVVQL